LCFVRLVLRDKVVGVFCAFSCAASALLCVSHYMGDPSTRKVIYIFWSRVQIHPKSEDNLHVERVSSTENLFPNVFPET
jgi:hypothetical protein